MLQPGDGENRIGGYKAGIDKDAVVDFSRAIDTRNGNGLQLPRASVKEDHPAYGSDARLLNMQSEGGVERLGVFNCEATKDAATYKIPTIILHEIGKRLIFFLKIFKSQNEEFKAFIPICHSDVLPSL